MVNGATPNHIEEGQLISVLINAKNQGEYRGVTVFIKGEKNKMMKVCQRANIRVAVANLFCCLKLHMKNIKGKNKRN
jgi:hypothetical protein